MDDGLPVKKGIIIEILEEEGEWCWCNHQRKVLRGWSGSRVGGLRSSLLSQETVCAVDLLSGIGPSVRTRRISRFRGLDACPTSICRYNFGRSFRRSNASPKRLTLSTQNPNLWLRLGFLTRRPRREAASWTRC